MSVSDARSAFFVDRGTGMLVGLFVLVQLAVAALALDAVSATEVATTQQEGDVRFSAYMAGVVVLETVIIVTAWRFSSIIPRWVWTGIKWGVLVSLALIALYYTYQTHGAMRVAIVLVAAGTIGPTMVLSDTYWIMHNFFAVAGTVFFAMVLGGMVQPRVLIAFLVLMTVWDMVAVWKSDWMDDLISMAAGTKLPVYYILPSGLRVDMDRFTTWLADRDGEKPKDVAAVLGVGDLAIPAALIVSCILALPEVARLWPVGGIIVGGAISMAVLRVSLQREGSLPALPWITTGTLSGFIIGVLVSGVSLLSVLGGVA